MNIDEKVVRRRSKGMRGCIGRDSQELVLSLFLRIGQPEMRFLTGRGYLVYWYNHSEFGGRSVNGQPSEGELLLLVIFSFLALIF